nr:hypothetical protein Iba_chr02bCG13030 [Ipomoea batatas]
MMKSDKTVPQHLSRSSIITTTGFSQFPCLLCHDAKREISAALRTKNNSLGADLVFFFPRIDLAVELRGCEALWRTKNGFRKSRRLPTTATKGATWRLFSETSEAEASGGRLSAHEDEAISEITMWPLQPC